MRKITFCLFGLLLLGLIPKLGAQSNQLVITEVVDATLPSGLPKFVELTNMGDDSIDLAEYSIGNYSNGNTTLGGGGSTVLSGILAPGESYVISYENGDSAGTGTFFEVYGVDPDNFDLGAFINGDDTIALFFGEATDDGSDATLIDVYGVIGEDGTGQIWEYTDGYAYRNLEVTEGNATFSPSEWVIGGANSLETGDDTEELALILATTTPGTPGGPNSGGAIAPVANAGDDQVIMDADGSGDELVTLDGSGSSDTDGSIESYLWTLNGEMLATGSNPSVTLPLGTNTVFLTVTDNDGLMASDEVLVTINALTTSSPALLITGVIDGPLSGGVPKAVELYALEDIADLSAYGIGSANNGGGTDGEEFALSGSAMGGQFLYVASESEGFASFFGFAPTFTSGSANINGDDAIELFLNGTVVDTFGDINTDGTGQLWEYLDGWAYRMDETGPDGTTFILDNWSFSGANALDGESANATAATPFPAGSYSVPVIVAPEEALKITGVMDGPLSGGTPKVVELYAVTEIADLSAYGIGSANNGGGTDGNEFSLSGSATAGEFIYIASDEANFNAFFGFNPNFTGNVAAINGDDAIELFYNDTVIDVFGDIDMDGTGQAWEYLDGWAYRVNDTGPDGSDFVLGNWSFSGPNALDGETLNATAAMPFPIGSFGGMLTNTIRIVATDAVKAEGDSGNTDFVFSITRTGDLTTATSVDYSVEGAVDANDFGGTLPTGTLDFQANESEIALLVSVSGDSEAEEDETFTVTLSGAANGETLTIPNASGTILDDDSEVVVTLISAVQGAGSASPLVGQEVTIEAVVSGDFQNGDTDTTRNLGGFFLQEEDTDTDDDPMTSEGIFVFEGVGDSPNTIEVGDIVRVTGTVVEFEGETQLGTIRQIEVLGSGTATPVSISLPFANVTSVDGDIIADLEPYEGMLVGFDSTLTVDEYFNYDRYGEIRLTSGDRPFQFTQISTPDANGFAAHLEDLAKRSLVLDDGRIDQNPDPLIYPSNLFGDANSFRGGDAVSGLVGNIRFSDGTNEGDFGDLVYRLMPTEAPSFTSQNPRPEAIEAVGGTLKVVSLNVLNYFTTLDENGASTAIGADPRGADNGAEFDRQTQKLVSAILQMDADVFGLVELENDFDANSDGNAIANLVNELNITASAGTYAWVDPGTQFVGDDAIAVGFIYRTTTVELVGDTAILDTAGFLDPNNSGENRNRAAVAQTFRELATGGVFTAAINHLKSKGRSGGTLPDTDSDTGDGQSFWSDTRAKGAAALVAWLSNDPTGSNDTDFIILGDLNAYAMETAITTLEALGYTDLARANNTNAYSFLFDGQLGTLDYAFANNDLLAQVSGAAEWHANADEPDALDYNLDFGRDTNLFDGTNGFRNSDHDPIIVGLSLGAPNEAPVITNETTDITVAVPTTTGNGARIAVNVAVQDDSDAVGDGLTFDQTSESAGRGFFGIGQNGNILFNRNVIDEPELFVGNTFAVEISVTDSDGATTIETFNITVTEAVEEKLVVTTFYLINADTDERMQEIPVGLGTILDVSVLPTMNLDIEAVTTGDVESVYLQLSGPISNTRTENFAPYALFGDSNGNFNGAEFPLGNYSIRATGYSGDNQSGESGVTVTAALRLETSDTTAPFITLLGNNPQEIELGGTYTELGATANDAVDGDLTNAIVIDSSRVDTSTAGTYMVNYSVMDAAGNIAGRNRTVIVTESQREPLSIVAFYLVDADTDERIMQLVDGDYDIQDLPSSLSIEAVATDDIGSVFLQLSGELSISRTENVAPYALFGDRDGGGDFDGMRFGQGAYTISATPFTGDNQSGVQGVAKTVNFTLSVILNGAIASSLSVYPNPAADTINVNLDDDGAAEIIAAQIYDFTGRLVKSVELGTHQELDVSDLQTGTYVVHTIDSNGNQYQEQIIVRR